MKSFAILFTAALSVACNSTVTYDMPSEEQMMAMMMEAGTPGPQHALLMSLAGTYDVAMTNYMAPGAPGEAMTATAVFAPSMDGRLITEDFQADFQGMPFQGRLVMGYDNVTRRWWNLWNDNMSTGYMLAHGAYTTDDAIATGGLVRDLITPQGRPTRSVLAGIGSDHVQFTMWDTGPDGHEYVVMEGAYTRRK